MRTRTTIGAAALAIGTALAATVAVAAPDGDSGSDAGSDTGDRTVAREDFNGDGYQDLAVGAPGKGSGEGSAGYITVLYGSAEGLDYDGAVTIDQSSPGVPGEQTPGNRFGARIAAGDLDDDGFTDLAVHAPGDGDTSPGSGNVTVLWGGEGGIAGDGAAAIGADDDGGSFWHIGHQLTAGDFNGDGARDLTMWRGQDDYSVLYGPFDRDGGWADEQVLDRDSGDSEVSTVVAGDITGDGADELVVFQAFEEMSRSTVVFEGGDGGMTRAADTLPDGATGAIGDFDGDGYGDLAYREVPGGVVENLPYDPGTVKVIYGTADGPGDRKATITQETPGVPGIDEEGDQFGAVLSAGDVTGDGVDDLAVGIPFEAIRDVSDAGSTVLLKGGGDGLTGAGAQAFHQDSRGVRGVAEAGDRFGSALRLLDVDGDGHAEMAASAPNEAIGDVADGGAAWSLPGTASGLTGSGSTAVNPTDIGSALPGVLFGKTFNGSVYGPLFSYN